PITSRFTPLRWQSISLGIGLLSGSQQSVRWSSTPWTDSRSLFWAPLSRTTATGNMVASCRPRLAVSIRTTRDGIGLFRASTPIAKASSSPGEFHPEALTDPCVNLSIHTALHSRSLISFESKPSREERAHPEHPVGRTLLRAMSSSSLTVHYRRFNATTG